ncbi:MAG: DUF2878 domain-containing protein [Rudaea sp.]|nr:DUF2878 domain-containing protein [Rudaea sp.]
MNLWINAILYQATWLVAIAGAAHDCWWAGLLALVVFASWQLAVSPQRRADVWLMLFAAVIGFAIDSTFAQTGLLEYAAATPWEHLAPAWIVALWISFALTLNHSLAYLKTHAWVGSALGGIGAPLAYLAAAHWGAIVFPASPMPSLLVLAAVWAVLTPALCRLAQTLCLHSSPATFALHGGPQ